MNNVPLLYFPLRFLRILIITILFVGLLPFRNGPRLLYWYFKSCDGTFIKFGQLLAMRYDLLPAEYCEALAELLDDVSPVKLAVLLPLIEQDLGRSIASCFASLESQPLGSASIAQVHAARLHTGEKVVIKVKRPHIENTLQVDFIVLKLLAGMIYTLGLLPSVNVRAMADELIRFTKTECNFRQEARNTQLAHDLMRTDEVNHYAPKVYFEYSGDHIIVMEQLEGVTLREYLRALDQNNTAQLAEWEAWGIVPEQIALSLLHSVLMQCYRYRVFHGDPHAANMILMQGGVVGYIDFGLIGWIDERQVIQDFQLNQHLINESFHAAYLSLLALLEPLPRRGLDNFEIEIKELLRNWSWDVQHPYVPLADKSTATFLLRLLGIARRYKIQVPLATLRLYRTFIIVDLIILKLHPQINRFPILKTFIEEETHFHNKRYVSESANFEQLVTAFIKSLGGVETVTQVATWIQYQFPRLGVQYQNEPGPVQHAFSSFLRGSRRLLLILIITTIVVQQFFPATVWASTTQSIGSVDLMLGALLVVVLSYLDSSPD